jgi:hypothetical protein
VFSICSSFDSSSSYCNVRFFDELDFTIGSILVAHRNLGRASRKYQYQDEYSSD